MDELPAVIPDDLDPAMLGELAREIAMAIRPREDVFRDFKITQDQYALIEGLTVYKSILIAAVKEWNSPLNTERRLQLEAAAALEYHFPVLAARMGSDNEPLNSCVEAAKFFAKVAGVGESKNSQGSQERFTININLGNNRTITLENAVTPREKIAIQHEEQPHSVGASIGTEIQTKCKREDRPEKILS